MAAELVGQRREHVFGHGVVPAAHLADEVAVARDIGREAVDRRPMPEVEVSDDALGLEGGQ